jgi:hypothetical protein
MSAASSSPTVMRLATFCTAFIKSVWSMPSSRRLRSLSARRSRMRLTRPGRRSARSFVSMSAPNTVAGDSAFRTRRCSIALRCVRSATWGVKSGSSFRAISYRLGTSCRASSARRAAGARGESPGAARRDGSVGTCGEELSELHERGTELLEALRETPRRSGDRRRPREAPLRGSPPVARAGGDPCGRT